jgi:hypothetical protein
MAYIASPIKYYRKTANNTAIAQQSKGVYTGYTPDQEITVPINGGTYVSTYDSVYINGAAVGTVNFNDFDEGQYLYYVDATSGNYVLVGLIEQIVDATHLKLTAVPSNNPPASGLVLAASYSIITNNESIYIRIPTVSASTNTVYMPNLAQWRNGDQTVKSTVSSWQRVSAAGSPLVPASPAAPVPFTIQSVNIFTPAGSDPASGDTTYFGSNTDLPTYIWLEATPKVGSSTFLSSQTLYSISTNESQPDALVQTGVTKSILIFYGYKMN